MRHSFFRNFNNWRNSLVGQLLLRFWVAHIIFFMVIGTMQYNSLKDSLYQSVEQNLLSDYNSIKNSLINWVDSSQPPPGRFAELRPGNFTAFYTPNGKLRFLIHSYGRLNDNVYQFLENPDFKLSEKALEAKPFTVGNSSSDKFMLLVQPILGTGSASAIGQWGIPGTLELPVLGYAVFGEPLLEESLILERNLRGYILNALLILLLSTLFSAYALKKPLEPLLDMSATARKIAGGRYNLRLPEQHTASEIEQLRDALNHMLSQMENALNTERTAKENMARFIADASHELRTPLTSIRGFLEILQRNKSTDKEILDSAHQTMLIETERLIRLTESLLTLNRLTREEQQPDKDKAPVSSLRTVFPELLPLLAPLLENRVLLVNDQVINGQDMEIEALTDSIPEQLFPVKDDELKQILYNLLNNAIQHTDEHGTLSITVKEEKEDIVITVADNGKGIPSADLPHIFERFFRGDRSRSRTKGEGSGLGLAIVSELVKARGGKIRAQSSIGQGTAIIISFPKQGGGKL